MGKSKAKSRKTKREREAKPLQALSKISEAITSDLYLEDVLKLVVTVTAETMGSKVCSIMLVDEQKGELVIRATQSISEDYNRKSNLKLGEGVAGKVAATNKPIIVPDVTQKKEYRFRDIAVKEGLRSLLCVPMRMKGKVIGVINLYTSKPHRFTQSEINLLLTVASQAAIVIENSRILFHAKLIREELETRKTVERAKGILMKELKFNEDEAFRKIQKLSMDSRKSMREVSEAILLTYKIK